MSITLNVAGGRQSLAEAAMNAEVRLFTTVLW